MEVFFVIICCFFHYCFIEVGENLGFLPGDLKEKLDPYMKWVDKDENTRYKTEILADKLTMLGKSNSQESSIENSSEDDLPF